MKITAVINFKDQLYCDESSLGTVTDLTFKCIRAKLHMPNRPVWSLSQSDPLHIPLEPPAITKDWKEGDKRMHWGRPTCYPKLKASVTQAAIEVELAGDTQEEVDAIHVALCTWLKRFEQLVCLITTQRTRRLIDRGQDFGGVSMFRTGDDGALVYINSSVARFISINTTDIDESLHHSHLLHACKLASSFSPVRFDYQLLLSCYLSVVMGDNRKAVFEAASAIEMCLTKAIQAECARRGIPTQLAKKYTMLSGRVELANILSIGCAEMKQQDIMLIRNRVVHDGTVPSYQETTWYVANAAAILAKVNPEYLEPSTDR